MQTKRVIIFDWGNTVMRIFPEYQGEMCSWPNVEFIPGVEKVLQSLQGNMKLVIATGAKDSNTAAMIKALKRVGAVKYFSHFFSSKDLGEKKPNKAFFSKIADKINVAPEECISIGDSYERDIVPASQVDMTTVFYNEQGKIGDFSNADFIIHNISDLLVAIDQL